MDREVVEKKPGRRGEIKPIAHFPKFEGDYERRD